MALTLALARVVMAFLRVLGPDRSANLGAFLACAIGPRLKNHKTALQNLRATFPDRDETEINRIAMAAWDNLGRTSLEYPHLRRLMDFDFYDQRPDRRIEVKGIDHFIALRDDGKPGIVFSAHLANWELTAIVAARYYLDVTAIYRPPNSPVAQRLAEEIRRETMGGLEASKPGAAFALRKVLEQGGHLGMLIDQHFSRGVPVLFLGRTAVTNPLLAVLARQFDCPVHGARAIRLPGHRFRLELTGPLDLPRDSDGRIDVAGATAAMTAVVESWVLEYPEQWLWMHRRWRTPTADARRQPSDSPQE